MWISILFGLMFLFSPLLPAAQPLPGPAEGRTFIRELRTAPFPYTGKVGDSDTDFLDFTDPDTGERFHTTRNGQRFPASLHYTDSRVLFHVPPGFNSRKPFTLLIYFHGHNSEVERTLAEQEIPAQIDASGRNVILIAPQLARDAVDSSPGKFYRPGAFGDFLAEATGILEHELGLTAKRRPRSSPVVLVGFSGAYRTVAYILDRGGVNGRIRGVILLDSLYDDLDKYEAWLVKNRKKVFLASLYTPSTADNQRQLMTGLKRQKVKFHFGRFAVLKSNSIFFKELETPHLDLPRLGPPHHPLAYLLRISRSITR